MRRYRYRPSPMMAAPILVLPQPIVRHLVRELCAWRGPEGPRAALEISAQLFPGSARHAVTLGPTSLETALISLVEIAIDMRGGRLAPGVCGFTLAEVQYAIDEHLHHYGPVNECY